VLAGVTGPRSLTLAGTVADGVLLPEYSSPAYIEAARRLIANPAASVTTYAWFYVDDDREAARAAVRRSLTPTSSLDAQLEPLGLTAHDIASHVPDDVIDQLAVVGTPRDCAAAISALHDAGVGSVVVLPALDQTEIQVTRLAQEVVPLLR
jgi:alkanesulfonate monooxygenase SsuD/methylene tetrahydromethanopterin reductase-like flavin-dependent oxidoreductase (luciferase family)